MSSAELSVFIRAIGVHTPERKLTNAELSKMVDTSDEWIKTRSGIAERRIAGPGLDPLVGGVHHLGQFGIGELAFRSVDPDGPNED